MRKGSSKLGRICRRRIIDDPAITIVEPHAVLGGSVRAEFDYGLIVLDDEMLDAELRALGH